MLPSLSETASSKLTNALSLIIPPQAKQLGQYSISRGSIHSQRKQLIFIGSFAGRQRLSPLREGMSFVILMTMNEADGSGTGVKFLRLLGGSFIATDGRGGVKCRCLT